MKNRQYRLPPRKDYHAYIKRSTYRYTYARQAQFNWEKGNTGKKKKESQK